MSRWFADFTVNDFLEHARQDNRSRLTSQRVRAAFVLHLAFLLIIVADIAGFQHGRMG